LHADISPDRATFSPAGASKPFVTRLVEISVPDSILARARAGDAGAQQFIYTAVAAATLTLIRRFVGPGATAQDLFQDTMMVMYERLGEFRGEAPLGAWLRQIAISKCLGHLRSPWNRVRLQLVAIETQVDPVPAPLTTPSTAAESLDIERALARLAPTARAVVWMYEVEGYTHEEIARAFGRSVSFSKSQLARAHARLRAWVAPQGTESHAH
jgi:RNA polymerase sigma-70 factor (ECF subfamily)